jgi:23S rRNA U2552 (ribose-2'-O)-methylase RlmE/FtsJ
LILWHKYTAYHYSDILKKEKINGYMNFLFEIEPDDACTHLEMQKIKKENNLLFKSQHTYLSREKEKIDSLENTKYWDKMKKIGNPYELIYTSSNRNRKNDSISQYVPISRSYFKLWEMFHTFPFFERFPEESPMCFSHLAEGPGGFMEATNNFCKGRKGGDHQYFGITLKPVSDSIPDWNKMKTIFGSHTNIHIEYGNLYNSEDVSRYIHYFEENKAHFITSDGGFDYSNNFNGQEIDSCQIIFSEMAIALQTLRKEGSFVCKVFDLFSITMVQLIYIVSHYFEKVYLYKPETSRPANSEKYLVCMYFKDNVPLSMKEELFTVIQNWTSFQEDESVFFSNIKVPSSFIHKIYEYNGSYIENQIHYLNNTLELTKQKLGREDYNKITKKQIVHAMQWCKKYNVTINTNSVYLRT